MTTSSEDRAAPGRVLLLVNRKSRRGDATLDQSIERLHSHGIEVIEPSVTETDGIGERIREYADEVDGVVIGGGDGTLNQAASALIDTGLPLGILPLGTGNDLSRNLALPADPVAACDVIASGYTTAIDVGCVNDIHFFNAASIGLGVHVTRRLTSGVKSRWGVLGYARTILDAFRATHTFSAEVICDGQREPLRSIQITVGNGRYYGGGMAVTRDAAIDDQMLDMYSLRPQGALRLLSLAPELRFGPTASDSVVDVRHAREIEIRTRRHKSVSTDGDLTTRTPAVFSVKREAVRVFQPAPPALDEG